MVKLFQLAIQHSTLIRVAPKRVYDALTTSSGLDAWFTTGATVDPRPGGQIRFRWLNWGPKRINTEDGGPILEAQRPTRFVFQWHPDNDDYATTVEIDLQPVQEGTILQLSETGYQDTPSGRAACLNCATGWGEALTLLKFYLEYGLTY